MMSELAGKLTGQSCKVCGDRSSGKHYGVSSCDGCRGFFKRSIRRNLEYHCKEGGKCIVDVSRRNQCQSCRFAKCLKANMRREAVQHERAPRTFMNQSHLPMNTLSSDLYNTNRLPLSSCGLFLPMPIPNTNLQKFPSIPNLRYLSQFQGRIFDSNHFGNNLYFSPPTETCSKSFSITGLSENFVEAPTIEKNTKASTIEYTSGKEDEVTSTEITTVIKNQINPKKEAIFESAAKLLFLAVKWARSVPSFTQLPSRDQTKLLEESWAELFVITSAQWGFTIDTNILPKDNGVSFLQKAINQFIALRIDHTESACLKALVLFKPETSGISSIHQISSLQEQTLNLLYEKCGGVRLGHVLLILPLIKTAANPQILQEMFFKGTVGEVAIERLLFDLMNT